MAVDAGIQKYEQGLHPAGDTLSKSEAERFLVMRGMRSTMLQKWTDAGLLNPVKKGERQNSKVVYSLADIKNVMFATEVKSICNN